MIVDDNVDNVSLLSGALTRKFPSAVIYPCAESATACAVAKQPLVTALIVCRTADMDGLPLLEMLRSAHPTLPILFVSTPDFREKAFTAGASAFLHHHAWLGAGAAVEDMLRTPFRPYPGSG